MLATALTSLVRRVGLGTRALASGASEMTDVLVLNQQEVRAMLPMEECVGVMEDAFRTLATTEVNLPVRQYLWLPEKRGALALMPCAYENIWGLKVSSTMPTNQGTKFPSHQGAVLLFEAQYGQMLAVIDCTEVTAIRTGAASAAATKILARENSKTLAVVGTGHQAQGHLDAMMVARPQIEKIRVYGIVPDHVQEFVAKNAAQYKIDVTSTDSVEAAVDGADIICTCTPSKEPILKKEFVAPGTHINAVGSAKPFTRELFPDLVKASRFYVDRIESCLSDAGDFILAREDGYVSDDHIIGDLGQVLTGQVKGRLSDDDITIFENVGIAMEDLAAAEYLYNKAKGLKQGTVVKLNSYR